MFKKIYKKTYVERVRDQIISLIARGKLVPGQKIPSEVELIKLLEVSRPVLREAIRSMIAEGLLEIKRGVGTFVQKPSSSTAIQKEVVYLLLKSKDFEDVMEIRMILEPEIAAKAAQNASVSDIEEIENLLEEMQEVKHENQEIFSLTWKFHTQLAQSCGNPAMAKLIEILCEMIKSFQLPLYKHFNKEEEIKQHRKIIESIKSGNPDEARRIMNLHLDYTHHLYSELWTSKGKKSSGKKYF